MGLMLVHFWGTRGSIAAPGPTTVRYGGNTSCVEVRAGGTLAILDCGTGARALGAHLVAEGSPVRAHIMLSHFHWDHIQGFPFFSPVFLPGAELHIYGARGLERGLEESMAGQMQYTYFPVQMADLRSRLTFHEVDEGTFQAGQMTVRAQFLNHPCPTLGYRITVGGTSIAYLTDHEPFWPHNPDLPLSDVLVHPGDRRHAAFVAGVDLLVHDAQYTAEEYPAHRGWGHSPIEYVVDIAITAGVRRLALFHHSPDRDDAGVDQLVAQARAHAQWRGATLDIFAAAEGEEVVLPETSTPAPASPDAPLASAPPLARIALLGTQDRRRSLREALAEDGYRLTEAELDDDPSRWLADNPDLVLVALPPHVDALAAIRSTRLVLKGQPVIAVLEGAVDETTLRRVGEAAADVVVAPFGWPNLRARVRACLARLHRVEARPRQAARATAMDGLRLKERLPAAELDMVLRHGVRCGFQPGEVLFRQGDSAGGVYYLHSGLVRVYVSARDGREVTVGFLGPKDTVGEMSALDGAPRSATAVALEPVEASYVPRGTFRRSLERSPIIAVRLLRHFSRRLRYMDERLAGQEVDAPAGAVGGRVGGPQPVALHQQPRVSGRDQSPAAPSVDLESVLEMEVERARRLRYPLGLVLGQVARGKRRSARGRFLPQWPYLVHMVRETLRRTDVVVATSSAGLGVVLLGLTPENLPMVETRVREAIIRAVRESGEHRATTRVRVGGSVIYPDEGDAHRLLGRALEALSAAGETS